MFIREKNQVLAWDSLEQKLEFHSLKLEANLDNMIVLVEGKFRSTRDIRSLTVLMELVG